MKTEASRSYLSSNAVFAVLLLTLLGLDFFDLPRFAARTGGPSGQWTIVVAFLIALPFIFLAAGYRRRFGDRNLLAAASLALGKPAAIAGNLIFLLALLAWMALIVRNAGDLILASGLNLTPLWVVLAGLLLFVVAVSYYISLIAGGLKQQFPGLNYRWTTAALLALVGAGALAVPNAATAYNLFTVLRWWAPVPVVGYILLVYAAAMIRGVRGSISAQE